MKNIIQKNISKISLATYIVLFPVISFATATITPCEVSGAVCNPISANNINDFIKAILEGAIKIGIPIIALAIIYSGFLFVKAQGKPEDLKTAKNAIMYTLLGAALLLGAWALAQLISETVLAL
ncbi:MAG: hypothetical protein NT068_03050 [Candidatus Nomurabacteria bacterium]|nr:hypothetical protein [Candidatus Nomurabacteria bacterium]